MKTKIKQFILFLTILFSTGCNTYRDLPTALKNPTEVKKLNLSKSGIVDLTPEIGNLTNLQTLNLFRNKIEKFLSFSTMIY